MTHPHTTSTRPAGRTSARSSRARTAAGGTTGARVLKDARRSAEPEPATLTAVGDDRAEITRIRLLKGTRTQYANYLATATSKDGDRYSRRTIDGYVEAVKAFESYLIEEDFGGDFTDVGVEEINAYLAHFRNSHTQAGTNTALRRIRRFFRWVVDTFDVDDPFATGRVAYYAPSKPAPTALGPGVIDDILDACRPVKGSPTYFNDVRDFAMISMLRSGVRRGELVNVWVDDVDFARQTVQVVKLKRKTTAAVLRVVDGWEFRAGRHVPISDQTAQAIHRWLKLRANHRHVRDGGPEVGPMTGPLWFGQRQAMTGNGVWRMIKRRAEAAGYDPATVNVHAFRHTRADQLKRARLADGDIMAVMGWSDRAMLDRYAANLASDRAIEAIRELGLA